MQRFSVSVPSSIAEGTTKRSDKHFLQYLDNVLGTAFKCENQLFIAFHIGYISKETFDYLKRKIQSIEGIITRFMEII